MLRAVRRASFVMVGRAVGAAGLPARLEWPPETRQITRVLRCAHTFSQRGGVGGISCAADLRTHGPTLSVCRSTKSQPACWTMACLYSLALPPYIPPPSLIDYSFRARSVTARTEGCGCVTCVCRGHELGGWWRDQHSGGCRLRWKHRAVLLRHCAGQPHQPDQVECLQAVLSGAAAGWGCDVEGCVVQ